jgi:hypothetical protein
LLVIPLRYPHVTAKISLRQSAGQYPRHYQLAQEPFSVLLGLDLGRKEVANRLERGLFGRCPWETPLSTLRGSLLDWPGILGASADGVDDELEREGEGDDVELGGEDDGGFAGGAEAITELGEQTAGHVVNAVVVVAAWPPKEGRRDTGFDACRRSVPAISAGGEDDGKSVEDGDEHGATCAELNFVKGVGQNLGVGTEAKVGDVGASKEDVAPHAEVQDGFVPEVMLGGSTRGAEGDGGGGLGIGPSGAGGSGDDKTDAKGDGKGDGRSAHAYVHRSGVGAGQCSADVVFHVKHPAWPFS